VSPADPLPPLVLRCRPSWLLLYGAAALALLGAGTACLAGVDADPSRPWLTTWAPPVLLAFGGGCAWFVARYCLASLILDDEGFRLAGPLVEAMVAWASVVYWERRRQRGGPATLRVVHGPGRDRLTIPLVYEQSEMLVAGLGQGRFPRG
jgi:hypothetical protein